MLDSPSLYFGLVKPVGADIDSLVHQLERALKLAGYGTICIKLSALLRETPVAQPFLAASSSAISAKHALMAAGDSLRTLVSADAMARLAVNELERIEAALDKGAYMGEFAGSLDENHRGTAVIFMSLMHPAETALLRSLYGERFFLISAFSREDSRIGNLVAEIMSHEPGDTGDDHARVVAVDAAKNLLLRERGLEFTDPISSRIQGAVRLNVEKTFYQADYFIDLDETVDYIVSEADRLVNLIFGDPFGIARPDEVGMALAFAAADQSASLARRVGSSIVRDGYVLATGRNDLPVSGGGQITVSSGSDDHFIRAIPDASEEERAAVFEDVVRSLTQVTGWVDSPLHAENPIEGLTGESMNTLVEWLLQQQTVQDSRVFDLIEFNPTVHAEMSAITGAARVGIGLKDGTLYTTTFPCHECTRHIVSSGIARVVYLEPYVKSRAEGLFPDQINLGSKQVAESETGRVEFAPFMGAAPRQHRTLFSWVERKRDKGRPVEFHLSTTSKLRSSIWPDMVNMQQIEVRESIRRLQRAVTESLATEIDDAASLARTLLVD